MRIGTWNLEGRWTAEHRQVLLDKECDLWLLTEVAAGTRLPGYAAVTTDADMLPGKAWAAVLSRRALAPLPEPHPASVAGRVDALVVCSSVLPWRGSGGQAPWEGSDHAERTAAAVDAIAGLPDGALVWGGDFNHALDGPEVAGSAGGAASIRRLLRQRDVEVPTIGQPHRLPDVRTIDHVAVPSAWMTTVSHQAAEGLSDHDLYVVEVVRS
jgi:hypothetical protein